MPPKDKAKKQVAIIGYGSQGRALALNLRDSGYAVTIGLAAGSKSRSAARRERFQAVVSVAAATQSADIICFAFPDHLHGRVYRDHIADHLKPNATLWFLHGTSIHFGFVKPPTSCDVILIAPHAPGVAVREKYLRERDISAFLAVQQNPTRKAVRTATSLAQACGFRKSRLVKTTFADEAIGDLFGEQSVLCGGLAMLISSGYQTLIERGIKPENAYLEVAYQLDLIIELIKKYGMDGMWQRISVAARFGSLVTGPRLIGRETRATMKRVLSEIESGQFARQLERLSEQDVANITASLNSLTPASFNKAARKFAR